MNGIIDQEQYVEIANRYVDAMVTLLAIEQVTSLDAGYEPQIVAARSAQERTEYSREDEETDGSISENKSEGVSQAKSSNTTRLGVDKGLATEVRKMLAVFLQKEQRDSCISTLLRTPDKVEAFASLPNTILSIPWSEDSDPRHRIGDSQSIAELADLRKSRADSQRFSAVLELCRRLLIPSEERVLFGVQRGSPGIEEPLQ